MIISLYPVAEESLGFLEEGCKRLWNIFRHGALVDILRVLVCLLGVVLALLLDGDHVRVLAHLELGWRCLVFHQLNGTTDDLEMCASDSSESIDDILVGGKPVDGLAAGLEVLNHGVEALGCGEVGVRDVHAVDDHGQLGAALLDCGLADEIPDVGHGGEDNALVRGDADVMLVNSGNLYED